MKSILFGTALALSATGVSAQTLPVFDETLGFEILSVVKDEGVIVYSAGDTFFCEVDEGPADRYLVLSPCIPIVGPKAAAAASAATTAGIQDADEFIRGLEGLPATFFVPSVRRVMTGLGCTIDMKTGEKAFLASLARDIAAEANYTGALSDDLIDEISRITEDAAEMMLDQGMIIVDRDAGTARLKSCR